jgi:glycosyltransferase involved in cell wall biosynthesis
MKKFLESPEIILEMGKKARERVVKNFSWDIAAEKLHNAYKIVLRHEK